MSILFAYEESISPAVVTKETTIGLDYKSDGLYVSSEGDICGMPHYFRQSADKLAKAQRKDFLQKKSTEIAN